MANFFGGLNADFWTGDNTDEVAFGEAGADRLNGGGGNDEVYGGTGDDVLTAGAGEDLLDGGADNDVLRGGLGNDMLLGGEGNDRLYGDQGSDFMFGGAGNDILYGFDGGDTFDGGDGDDMVSFALSAGSVHMDFVTSAFGGAAAGSTFNSIELFNLTASNDYFRWSGFQNIIVDGGAGHDVLEGGYGNDRITGGAGDDYIYASDGNDILEGGAGADILDGSWHIDTVTYASSTGAVTIDLDDGGANTGDAAGDTFYNIEAYNLTRFSDTFYGSDFGDDNVRGGTGNDNLYGRGGSDLLRGDQGADVLDGGAGNDVLDGGLGADTLIGGDGVDIAFYGRAAQAVTINLTTGAHVGEAYRDTFSGIELYSLSQHNDRFTGDASDNRANGQAGDDVLNGMGGRDLLQGGAGNDSIFGGDGADILMGEAGNDFLHAGADTQADQFRFRSGDFGHDVLFDFEQGEDKIVINSGAGGADDVSDFVIGTGLYGVTLTLPDGSVIEVAGYGPGDIDPSDFIFTGGPI